jgi:hypothetical protein
MENNTIEMELNNTEIVNNDMIEDEEIETVDADDVIIVEPEKEGFDYGPLVGAGALAGLAIALAWLAHRRGKKKKSADESYEELKQEMMREAAKRGEIVTFDKVEDDSDAESNNIDSEEEIEN